MGLFSPVIGVPLHVFLLGSPSSQVIFTLNASNAIKIVGQNYPFENGQVLLLSENHNSISGLREYAMKAGASVCYLPVTAPELRASDKSPKA